MREIPSLWASRDTGLDQTIKDSAGARPEFISNGSHAHAALVHGDHVCINYLAPQRRLVMSGMTRMSGEFKILDSIVGLDPIDVMDNLLRQELAPQLPLHDRTMLEDSSPIVKCDSTIASVIDAACSWSASMVRSESIAPFVKFAEVSGAHSVPVHLNFGLALAVRNHAHG
jgi:hypothetical protein